MVSEFVGFFFNHQFRPKSLDNFYVKLIKKSAKQPFLTKLEITKFSLCQGKLNFSIKIDFIFINKQQNKRILFFSFNYVTDFEEIKLEKDLC